MSYFCKNSLKDNFLGRHWGYDSSVFWFIGFSCQTKSLAVIRSDKPFRVQRYDKKHQQAASVVYTISKRLKRQEEVRDCPIPNNAEISNQTSLCHSMIWPCHSGSVKLSHSSRDISKKLWKLVKFTVSIIDFKFFVGCRKTLTKKLGFPV